MVKIELFDKNDICFFSRKGNNSSHLLIYRVYEEGDRLEISAPAGSFLRIHLDSCLASSIVYAKEEKFIYTIPFGEERMPYPTGAFSGEYHSVDAVLADKTELSGIRDISTNPNDKRGSTAFYPHCTASVETRGESVFTARNTIDGYTQTNGHGIWPFTSWGDNEDPDAEIQIWFGREVIVHEVAINLRSDFPHDNYWHHADLVFSDGSSMTIALNKTGDTQSFRASEKKCEWVRLCRLRKDENDPSPFPALTHWRIIGTEYND